jgi:tetratricopeptide (TPR) repeat protein
LTGKPPLEGDDIGELLRKAQRSEFPPPRQIDPSIDRALEAVCLKAMALKPEDRYARPRLLAEDIERWTADEPVTAWREPTSRRLLRWLTRHRTGTAAAGAALLVALAGTGAVLAVQTRANADLKLANSALAIANQKVTTSNAGLQAANERERTRFSLALEAIKAFHTGVSRDILLKEKAFEGLRKKLLTGAADFYGKLEARLRDQPDRDSRSALSLAYGELAELMHEIGSQERAMALYRQSYQLLKTLAAEPDAPSSDRLNLVRMLLDLGRANQRIGQLEPARAAFEESLKLVDQLPSEVDSKSARSLLARCFWNLAAVEIEASHPDRAIAADTKAGMIQQKLVEEYPNDLALMVDLVNTDLSTGYNLIAYMRKPADALVYLERARAVQERVVAAEPDNSLYLRILSECSSLIGLVQLELGRPASALIALDRSQAILRKLVEKDPNVTMFQDFLAGNLGNIGIAHARVGDRQKSLKAYTASRLILEKLVAGDPSAVKYQRDLASTLNNIGDVELGLGRVGEAFQAYSQARNVLEPLVKAHPNAQDFQQGLAFSLAGQGRARLKQGAAAAGVADLRAASAIWDRLTLSTNESLYVLAGNHALVAAAAQVPGSGVSASEAEVEARWAIERLGKPLAAGYHSVAELRADPDFRALSGRSDFEAMLFDLQFPRDPFKQP